MESARGGEGGDLAQWEPEGLGGAPHRRQVLRSGSLRLARGRGFHAVAASLPSQSPGLPTEDISRTGQLLYFQPDSLKAGPEGT